MKHYQSVKKVHAEPMSARDFMAIVHKRLAPDCGKPTPDQEGANADGYHVIYRKGEHSEYHSWSPKEAFEKGNVEITETEEQPWIS